VSTGRVALAFMLNGEPVMCEVAPGNRVVDVIRRRGVASDNVDPAPFWSMVNPR